jgi:GNAT superfamily N-acetyltransferase
MSQASRVRARQAASGKRCDAAHPAALVVRPAGRSDLAPLNFFFDTLLRRDYFVRRGQLEELVSGRHHQVHVAELDTVLVGVAITTRGSRLVNALVHPAYRGLGIGTALVRGSGATEVRAKLDMTGGDPRAFYRSLGFVSTGRRNGTGNIEILRLAENGKTDGAKRRARRNTSPANRKPEKSGTTLRDRKSGK